MSAMGHFRKVGSVVLVFSVLLSSHIVAEDKYTPTENQSLSASSSTAKDTWLLAKYDGNGDRIISEEEIASKREKIFSYMDTDNDGKVSLTEYQALDTKRRELIVKARFAKLDLNADGILNDDEYSSYLGSFERFDHNNDGRITAGEIQYSTSKNSDDTDKKVRCLLWLCVRSELN